MDIMEIMDTVNLILAIISGLATAIPLVIVLVKYIKVAAKSKNWAPLMQLVLKFMTEAETNFENGAEREEFVIDSIKAMESTLNYDVDEAAIRAMIKAVIDATKKINVKK